MYLHQKQLSLTCVYKYCLGLALCGCLGFQRADLPTVVIRLPNSNCLVRTDEIGNTFVVNKEEILKYNATGTFMKRYSNKRFGNITTIDCTNPLKLLVYYKDFQQLLILDNQLTPNSDPISLEELGFEQTDLVCVSVNNSFWLYNKQNNELVRLNEQLQPIVKTGNLKQILQTNLVPNLIKEHNGYLYMNCPDEGVLLFDIYGTFYKTYPLKQLKEFDIVNETVVFYKDHKLQQYQPKTFNTAQKEIGDTLVRTVYWQKEQFYCVYPDSVLVKGSL